MKFFRLMRKEDVSGSSGTGVVAYGMIFSNGKCVFTWRSEIGTVTVADSITQIEDLHTHGDKTDVEIFDAEDYVYTKDLILFFNGEPLDNLKKRKGELDVQSISKPPKDGQKPRKKRVKKEKI